MSSTYEHDVASTRFGARGGNLRRGLPPAEIAAAALAEIDISNGTMRVRDRCLVRLALVYGLSFETIAALRLSDLDLHRQVLRSPVQPDDAAGEAFTLCAEACTDLQGWLKKRRTLGAMTDELFLTDQGAGLSFERVRNVVRTAERRAWKVQAAAKMGLRVRRKSGCKKSDRPK